MSTERLAAVLTEAVALRRRCIAMHPLYNSSSFSSTRYPFSQHYLFRDGLLVRSAARKEVYQLEAGKKRQFVNGRAFLNRGLDFDDVKVVADQWLFDQIPFGDVLP